MAATEYALLSTTTSFSRLRGMTLWVMEILRDNGSMTSWQVAEETEHSRRYANVYLNRLRNYGIALKYEEFWFLTDFGEYLSSLLCRDRDRDRDNRRITQGKHKDNTSAQKRPFQVTIQAWLRNSSPGDAERAVVDVLVDHYNKTGSKYILVGDQYAMSDMLSINVNDVSAALARLRQDGVVYLLRDPTSGCWKLGLKKAFVEMLEKEQK